MMTWSHWNVKFFLFDSEILLSCGCRMLFALTAILCNYVQYLWHNNVSACENELLDFFYLVVEKSLSRVSETHMNHDMEQLLRCQIA